MLPDSGDPTLRSRKSSLLWIGAVAVLAALLSIRGLAEALPVANWWQATRDPDPDDLRQLLFHHSLLPRTVMSITIGAALGLAGCLMQQALRNPLAEPTTLGTTAGAGLAIATVTLYAPDLLTDRIWLATAGAAAATATTLLLASRNGLSPLSLLLAGMVVSLVCGATIGVLALFNHEYLTTLFLWQAGSLVQTGWQNVFLAAPVILIACAVSTLMVRPLTLLDLQDSGARSLGIAPGRLRLIAIAIAVVVTGLVVSVVGIIAFVGLAAPAMARLIGARTFKDRLLLSPIVGAVLLWLADQVARTLGAASGGVVPVGIITSLLGAVLFLVLLRRFSGGLPPPGRSAESSRTRHPRLTIAVGALALAVVTTIALYLGREAGGWHWSGIAEASLLQWRAPRIAAAGASGAMLALAGVLLQRVTANPLASPEILGISSGAALCVVIALLFVRSVGPTTLLLPAMIGAGLALVGLLLLVRRSDYAPERLLLTGIALTTLLSAIVQFVLLAGHPQLDLTLRILAGSTYFVTSGQALVALVIAVLGLAAAPLTARWLSVLPLGAASAAALGVPVATSRVLLLIGASLLTAASTIAVGPLSFVGLMAPHMARTLGLARPVSLLAGAALIGATIMVAADWIGRTIAFPWQIPAGILASLIGGPYFLLLMVRRSSP